MSETEQDIAIRINGKPYLVDRKVPSISYEQIVKIAKVPLGTTVVYMRTKRCKEEDFRSGILDFKQKVDLEDGLSISAIVPESEPLLN